MATSKQQKVLDRIEAIQKSLDNAKKAIKAGTDPFEGIDAAFHDLNKMHRQIDEGELVLGKPRAEIEKVANELYYSEGVNLSNPCREAYDEAHKLYPEANDGGADTDDAQEYIVDRLMESMQADKKHGGVEGWSENDLQRLREELGEMIYAGLT